MKRLLALLALGCTPQPLDTGAADTTEDTGAIDTPNDTGETSPNDTASPEDTGAADAEVTHPTTPPALPTYSGGTCPALVSGPTSDAALNTGFSSGGVDRQFRLLVPEHYDGSEPMPLVFAWHWIGSSSNSFISQGEMESAVEQMDFIAVFPDSTGGYLFDWPFFETWDAPAEIGFFEDLLACVSEQYNVDPYQIHGLGVSAGALWVTYLSTLEQSEYFASVMSLSGGLIDAYGLWSMQWIAQPRKFPAFVLSGGPTDWLGINFYEATNTYRDALLDDQHFTIYCEHSDGHDMPPMDPPEEGFTTFYALWSFFLDHPYDLEAGESPYLDGGLPDYYPEWCEIAE